MSRITCHFSVKGLASLCLADAFALAASLARAGARLDKIEQRHAISVGVILSGPPFGTIDPKNGKHLGYNVELAQGVAKALGVELKTVSVLAQNRVQFLQQGKVDILIANMQFTGERGEILDYVPTLYEEVGGAALIRKGPGITQWADLKGKPVCVSHQAVAGNLRRTNQGIPQSVRVIVFGTRQWLRGGGACQPDHACGVERCRMGRL